FWRGIPRKTCRATNTTFTEACIAPGDFGTSHIPMFGGYRASGRPREAGAEALATQPFALGAEVERHTLSPRDASRTSVRARSEARLRGLFRFPEQRFPSGTAGRGRRCISRKLNMPEMAICTSPIR